jgi:integrator complex subunit 3
VPEVYIQFPSVAIGHAQLLHLVVSTVDAAQLQDLVCHILQGRLVMFRSDSFRALLSASLSWETFEQYCLWQLVTAHGIPIDYVLPILPRLEFSSHAEALTSILLMLKQERYVSAIITAVFFGIRRNVIISITGFLNLFVGQTHNFEICAGSSCHCKQ